MNKRTTVEIGFFCLIDFNVISSLRRQKINDGQNVTLGNFLMFEFPFCTNKTMFTSDLATKNPISTVVLLFIAVYI